MGKSNLWILDVWGEGRIVTREGMVTGFSEALNVNKYDQKISNGPNAGKDIPNLSPVYEYANPKFEIESGAFEYITLMGAPITTGTASEMCRVFTNLPNSGAIYLYDPDPTSFLNFRNEAVNHNVIYAGRLSVVSLEPPFNEITLQAVECFVRE
ncbi:hypothetical protein RM407_001520 [Enterobacter kobei]|nr:hypothetical protein [Enterobacter kobei]